MCGVGMWRTAATTARIQKYEETEQDTASDMECRVVLVVHDAR